MTNKREMMDILNAAFNNPESALISLSVIVSLLWQAWGLAVSRQWFLLPMAMGLSGLAGFLVNPIADSTSAVDLRNELLRGSGLLLLCMFQLSLSAASIWLGLRAASGQPAGRWQLLLGCLHCVPVAMVLVGAIMLEQHWLAQQVGARPEWVGLCVGSALAGCLLVLTGLFAVLPTALQIKGHLVSGMWVGVLAALLTSLDSDLPAKSSAADTALMLRELLVGLVVATVFVAVGLLWERWRLRQQRHQQTGSNA